MPAKKKNDVKKNGKRNHANGVQVHKTHGDQASNGSTEAKSVKAAPAALSTTNDVKRQYLAVRTSSPSGTAASNGEADAKAPRTSQTPEKRPTALATSPITPPLPTSTTPPLPPSRAAPSLTAEETAEERAEWLRKERNSTVAPFRSLKRHAFSSAGVVDRMLDREFCEQLDWFDPNDWDFKHGMSCKPSTKVSELGIIWIEDTSGDEMRLKGVYIIGLRPGSQAAHQGLRMPSNIVSINGDEIAGMSRNDVRALLKGQPQSIVFGQGQPKDAANPMTCLETWKALNAKHRIPSIKPPERSGVLAFCSDRTETRGQEAEGRYSVCKPTVEDANQLFTLGLEFLFDHIQLGVELDEKKEWLKDTTVGKWRNSIGLWESEQDVRTRISTMKANFNAEKYIFKCIHEHMDPDNKERCELVGFVEFSVFKDKVSNDVRKLFCAKLKITQNHQRRYVARHVYQSTLKYLGHDMAAIRPHIFKNLQGCVLKVFSDNTVARQLYESLGFKFKSEHDMVNLPRLKIARMDAAMETEESEDSDGYARQSRH